MSGHGDEGEARRERHLRRASRLQAMDDHALRAVLKAAGNIREGWGTNRVVRIDGAPVFVKSLPLTALEYERAALL
ncbi:MAG: hypothetical protein OEZ06_12175 [Myxococcales bacterium]|nr:hypothetical protein [Myxococcales bacterium]